MYYMTRLDQNVPNEVAQFMVRQWFNMFIQHLTHSRFPVAIVNINELRYSRSLFDPTAHGVSLLLYALTKHSLLTPDVVNAWIRSSEHRAEPDDFALVKDALSSLDELGQLQLADARDVEALTLACMDLYGVNVVAEHIKKSNGRYDDEEEVPGNSFYQTLQYIDDSFFDDYEYVLIDLIVRHHKLSFLDLQIQNEQSYGSFAIVEKPFALALKHLSEDSLESLDVDTTYDIVYDNSESEHQYSVSRFYPLRGGGFSCITRRKRTSSPSPTRLLD